MRPVAEFQFMDFIGCAFNQITNMVAKAHYRWGAPAPMVIRGPSGGNVHGGPFHSQNPEMYFVHTPGLKVVCPATAYDAQGLIKSAIRDNNPVIFFECSRLASIVGPVPEGEWTVPLGVAEVKRAGSDVTVVGLAYYVREALAVADQLAPEGISIEVIDPRTLVPMDVDTIRASVRKTGRLVVVDEAPATCSAASEIIALVTEDPETFRALKSPVQRVCAAPVPVPFSPPLEQAALPDQARLIAAIRRTLEPAPATV
jgi:2-oxoisovalerate dehydrogenase E1 component beta subunit